ncbi:MAG: tyrosine--tRNA ligase, partial [Candidatus Dormibacteraceae bacterium]
RFTDAEVGLTYTEFSYSLLQAYDFLRLRADHNVTLQMGASDQWGNIVAGIDYVRRVLGQPVYGLTCPLLLRSDGSKFGKSEKGAVWLSPDRTSPYSLFQFLLNLSDEEARRFALFFSLEPREQIEKLLAEHAEQPGRRQLQRQIAQETTTLVHGQDACEKAIAASAALFSGQVGSISREMLGDVFADVPTTEMALEQLAGEGLTVLELLISTGLAASRREARGHLQSGAVLINGDKAGLEQMIRAENLLHDSVILLRRGKREWRVIRFSGAR